MFINDIVHAVEQIVNPVPEIEWIERNDFVFYTPASAQQFAAFVLDTEPETQTAHIEYCFYSEYKGAWVISSTWATVNELALTDLDTVKRFVGVAQ